MKRARRALALVPAAALAAGLLAVAPAAHATFPGENGNVVWASNSFPEGPSDPITGDIWLSDPDGTDPVNLTQTPNDQDSWPALSPDGNAMVFSSDRDGDDLDLYLMDLETLGVSPLPSTGADEGWSAFSPDGTELAFVETSGQTQTIKVLNLDSGNKRTIGEGWHPNWSPDGDKIAFIRSVNNGNDIMVVDSDGGTPENMTESVGIYEFGPDWSPNGNSIIYSSDEGTQFAEVNLWIMDAGGFGTGQVTDLPGWESEPTFSPDGTQILFTHSPNPTPGNYGGQAIYRANNDGTDMELVYDSALIEDHPQWQVVGGGGSKVDTTVGVAVKKARTKTKVSGFVDPDVSGAEVVVTYYKKKSGTYQPLQTKDVVTDSEGNFKTAFKRKKPGKCLVTADYYGDEHHHASGAEVKFKC